ncbi:MAG: methyltransferase domain-containing protein [Pirellulales bacterium]|nr:methyltransferase domain-containing protein [Pirellulales bacterium]
MEETLFEAVRQEYRQLAPSYDQRWRSYLARTAEETLAHLDPLPQARVLDVGCGTGYVLAKLAEREPTIRAVGIDPSAEMLHLARQRDLPQASFLEGVAENIPLADASVDTVLSTSAFHFWYDPNRGLQEIRRVLRPGGQLVLTDWCDDFLTCRLGTWWLRIIGRPQNAVLGSRACAALVRQAGFVDVAIRTFRAGWWWGMMAACGRKPADGSPTTAERLY